MHAMVGGINPLQHETNTNNIIRFRLHSKHTRPNFDAKSFLPSPQKTLCQQNAELFGIKEGAYLLTYLLHGAKSFLRS